MQVWQTVSASATVYLDVSGSLADGYRIVRQVLSSNDEAETSWQLTPAQSRQLRTRLAASVVNDSLEPTPDADADASFDRLVIHALESLTPAPEPFTYVTWD